MGSSISRTPKDQDTSIALVPLGNSADPVRSSTVTDSETRFAALASLATSAAQAAPVSSAALAPLATSAAQASTVSSAAVSDSDSEKRFAALAPLTTSAAQAAPVSSAAITNPCTVKGCQMITKNLCLIDMIANTRLSYSERQAIKKKRGSLSELKSDSNLKCERCAKDSLEQLIRVLLKSSKGVDKDGTTKLTLPYEIDADRIKNTDLIDLLNTEITIVKASDLNVIARGFLAVKDSANQYRNLLFTTNFFRTNYKQLIKAETVRERLKEIAEQRLR